jgi:O-antigen/teichoic acid export membrane protein
MNFQQLLAKSLLWRGFYFVVVLALNIILSRFLQASLSGIIFYLNAIFAFIVLILSISLDSAFGYFGSANIIDKTKLAWLGVFWTIAITAISYAVIYFFPAILFGVKTDYIFYGLCYVTGIILYNLISQLYYAEKDFVTPNLLMIIVFSVLGVLILLLQNTTYSSEIVNLYFLFFPVQGIVLAIGYIVKHKGWNNISLPSASQMKPLLSYALKALAANVIFFFVYRIDYWFVHRSPVCTDADLGNYIQASKLGQMLLIVPSVIASAVLPQTANNIDTKAEVRSALGIITRLFLVVYAALMIILFFWGKQVFTFVFGETFSTMHVPFILLIPGLFSLSLLMILSAYFGGMDKIRINLIGSAIALVFVGIADAIFIPLYGVAAAAIISSVGYSLNLAYSLFHFYKEKPFAMNTAIKFKRSDWIWLRELFFKFPQ